MRDAPDRAALARLADEAAAADRVPEAVALARAVIARENAAGAAPVEAWAQRLADLFIAPDGEEFASIPTAPLGGVLTTIDRRVSRK